MRKQFSLSTSLFFRHIPQKPSKMPTVEGTPPTVSTVEEELRENDSNNSWHLVYGRMKNRASLDHMNHTVKEARQPNNRRLNRYRDVHPYDHSRIILESSEGDYINANLAQVPNINTRYILTQIPLKYIIGAQKIYAQMYWT